MKSRYFFYLILLDMLINTIILVPTIINRDRFHGAIMSMILAILIGSLLAVIFSKALNRFPGKGLPELLKMTLPKWLHIPILLYLGIMWYIAGAMVLISFALISRRYINPDLSLIVTILVFMGIAGWGASKPSKTVLYIAEIVLVLNVPFIFIILIKALTSPFMRWKEVFAMGSYVFTWPTLNSLSAATYLFTGYINMSIFHRVFQEKLKLRYFWVIPVLGFFNFVSSFAIPIGFHGPQAVNEYVYPWINTADAMKMELGFIARVLFIFLMLYISISLLVGIVVWHVALELFKSAIETKEEKKWQKWLPYGILALFFIPPLIFLNLGDNNTFLLFAVGWLKHRFIAEILLVGIVYFLARRKNVA